MSNISTDTNSQNTFPTVKVEKKTRVQNSLESSLEEPLGYFSPDKPQPTGFSAYGSMNLTNGESYQIPVAEPNLDKKVPDAAVSSIFNGGFVALDTAKTGLGAITSALFGAAKDTLGAATDIIAFETPKEKSPEKQAEEEKKAVEVQYQNQDMQNTEDEITRVRNIKESLAQMAPMQNEISEITGLQAMLSGKDRLVTEDGIRIDLRDDVAHAREQIMRAQKGQSNDLTLTTKQKQGIDTRADHVEQQGATAQTAVG